MNCDRCPHMAAIRRALAPCQRCDAGRLQGTLHSSRHEEALVERRVRTEPSAEGVTNLHPDAEDAMRKALASIFSLDPVLLLMARERMLGGGNEEFSATLLAFGRRIMRLKGAGRGGKRRMNAYAWKVSSRLREESPLMALVMPRNDRCAYKPRKRPSCASAQKAGDEPTEGRGRAGGVFPSLLGDSAGAQGAAGAAGGGVGTPDAATNGKPGGRGHA